MVIPRMRYNQIPVTKRRNSWFTLRRLVAGVATVAGWLLLANGCGIWPFGRPFNPIAWNDPVQVKQGVRLAMADRLVGQRALLNMTENQVVGLLGRPDTRSFMPEGLVLTYELGRERGFTFMGFEALEVTIGEEGFVVKSAIITYD